MPDWWMARRYAQKWGRIKAASPHGRRPGWAARPVIVKSGDDCRQELLAAQLVDAFYEIFQVNPDPVSVQWIVGY